MRTGEPNRLIVTGGTPRQVHSRSNAAIALGCARKNAGFFQTRASSSSRSSGVGAPYRVLIRIAGSAEWIRPNFLLLTISHSCRSLIPSTVSRICSSSWS